MADTKSDAGLWGALPAGLPGWAMAPCWVLAHVPSILLATAWWDTGRLYFGLCDCGGDRPCAWEVTAAPGLDPCMEQLQGQVVSVIILELEMKQGTTTAEWACQQDKN